MLYLLKQESGSTFFYLINGKEYVVGRKNADITITDDPSISRQHAIIKIVNDSVKLIDCGSKYGTVHRGNKIEPNIEVQMENQEVIKFGVFHSIYKIEKVNIVTTGSGLSAPQKNLLKKNLEVLGGTFLNNWDSQCTYLTVQEVMLTIKVLHALIDGKPFVTLEYWSKFAENFKENQSPPKVEDFKPKIAEVLLNTSLMDSNPQRRVLFKGKTFVFPNDKLKSKMDDLIIKTGGECISLEQQNLQLLDITNSKNKYIFIHSDEVKQVPGSLKYIYEHLKKLGQRTIPVQEIAMAVMMCTCEKDCNPFFDRVRKVFKEENDSCSKVFPLACETQSQDRTIQPKEEIFIAASLDTDIDWQFVKPKESLPNANCRASTSTTTSKRTLEETSEKNLKKVKMDNMKEQIISSESKKRKSDESLGPPPKKSTLKENPFAILNKRKRLEIEADNPFTNLKVKQEKNLNNTSLEDVESNNDVKQVEMFSGSSSLSGTSSGFCSKSKSSNGSDIKWLSKNSTGDVKLENSVIKEEFKEIYERFQNTVIIEILPIPERCVNQLGSLDGPIKRESGKNFKMFKKVHPKRPQSSVISLTISQVANTTANKEITILSDGEEDDEAPNLFRKIANKSKRFGY